ncbi:MAG: acyltransferase family protein [Clostridia bacterium]|nr:acyltransferase family protein [Clostridia bacterium]
MKKQRSASLDIVRIIAFLLVVSVHSMLNGGFYYQQILEPKMIIMTSLRAIFMCCVPLFMVISGYLSLNKKVEKKFYYRIIRVVFVYFFSSLFCELFRVFFQNNSFDFGQFLLDVLAFKAAPYSWYIHMYLGLFLLFPFFNACWKGLEDGPNDQSEPEPKKNGWDAAKKKRAVLVFSLLALTALPSLVNTYDLVTEGWWDVPASSSDYTQLIPQWWVAIYPISYYFIGAWFRTYPPKMRPIQYALLTINFSLLFGFYDYYRSRGANFVWAAFNEHYSFQSVILTWVIFAFWLSLPCDRLPKPIRSVLGFVSDLTLGAYLTSWIFDQVVYKKLEQRFPYPDIPARFVYYPLCIAVSALGALAASAVIWVLWKGAEAGTGALIRLIKKKLPQKKNAEE